MAKYKPKRGQKLQAAVELGKRGGKVGGPARAKALAPSQRKAIAKKGAKARWKGGSPKSFKKGRGG